MTAYDSWTEADLEEANKVDMKRETLQVPCPLYLSFYSQFVNNTF